MSATSRAVGKIIHFDEIEAFYIAIGKRVPTWVKKSHEQNLPLALAAQKTGGFEGDTSPGYLGAINRLLTEQEIQEPHRSQILKAQVLFQRFNEAFIAFGELKKQEPKHREAILALFTEAEALWLPIQELWQNYGDPGSYPQPPKP